MKTSTVLILLSCVARLTLAGTPENALKDSQGWQFALASAVKQLVAEGQTDPKVIAKLATERTKGEEKKVRQAGLAMGVPPKKVDQSIKEDRESSLKEYIEAFLPRKK